MLNVVMLSFVAPSLSYQFYFLRPQAVTENYARKILPYATPVNCTRNFYIFSPELVKTGNNLKSFQNIIYFYFFKHVLFTNVILFSYVSLALFHLAVNISQTINYTSNPSHLCAENF